LRGTYGKLLYILNANILAFNICLWLGEYAKISNTFLGLSWWFICLCYSYTFSVG